MPSQDAPTALSTIEVDLYVEFYDNVLTCDTITFTVTIEAVTIGIRVFR